VRGAAGVLFAGCLCVASGTAVAERTNVQFSAQAVQSAADGKNRNAQIFVGDNQVRLEYTKDDQFMVEIYDMKNQRALLLVPQQSSYMQRQMSNGRIGNPMLPPSQSDPCVHVPAAKCSYLTSESMHGRKVTKWEMVVNREGQNLNSLRWIDDVRHIPLREQWPDGTVSELRPLGQESLNGRPAERWEMKVTRPDGKQMLSTQWYDPELQIAVREELPGGNYRELRSIRIGLQPEQLFSVPAGYKQLEPTEVDRSPAAVSPGHVPYPEHQVPRR
jgi:hypothetical protein